MFSALRAQMFILVKNYMYTHLIVFKNADSIVLKQLQFKSQRPWR